MTQNYREELKNARLEAASKYLSDIADNFKTQINTAAISNPTLKNACAIFGDDCLKKVSKKELLQLEGFKKLRDVCADPAIDMALGPIAYDLINLADAPAYAMCIYVAKPYAESGFLEAAKEMQKQEKAQLKRENKKKPGRLRRAFAHLKERLIIEPEVKGGYTGGPTPPGKPPVPAIFKKEGLELHKGYIEVTPDVPAPTKGPFTPPPRLS